MTGTENLELAAGLDAEAREAVEELLAVGARVRGRNRRLADYYEGDFSPRRLGVKTVPDEARVPECCGWPRKAVTCVSERSRFEGFAFEGDPDPSLSDAADRSGLAVAYARNLDSQLVHGCMFATVGRSGRGSVVRFHTADSAVATWDQVRGRVDRGMVVADVGRTDWSPTAPVPTQVNLHMPDRVVVVRRTGAASWAAESLPHPMGRPLMEAFAFRATGMKPFGQSRITKSVMAISDDVVRTLQDMAVSAAFYAAPQKWLMGLTDEQFDALVEDKWSTNIGSLLLGTRDPESGQSPTVGQFSAASPQPYIDLLRTYAQMFSAETGVPLNSLGIVQDNPSSAEAIQASREDVCMVVEDLNDANGQSLRNVALMAMAVANDTDLDGLTDLQRSVSARFRPPLTPTMSAQADAMSKLAGVDPAFAGTREFYEGLGFDEATVRRIMSDKARAQARGALNAILGRSAGVSAGEDDQGAGR